MSHGTYLSCRRQVSIVTTHDWILSNIVLLHTSQLGLRVSYDWWIVWLPDVAHILVSRHNNKMSWYTCQLWLPVSRDWCSLFMNQSCGGTCHECLMSYISCCYSRISHVVLLIMNESYHTCRVTPHVSSHTTRVESHHTCRVTPHVSCYYSWISHIVLLLINESCDT